MEAWKFVSSCSSCFSWINFQVEDLNAKWQKYDASRDEYVRRLHLQLKEMKSQLEQPPSGTPAQRNSDLMHKEICRLNKLLEEKMNECIKTKRELEDVKKAREGDNERIQMLEQQVIKFLFPRDGNSFPSFPVTSQTTEVQGGEKGFIFWTFTCLCTFGYIDT